MPKELAIFQTPDELQYTRRKFLTGQRRHNIWELEVQDAVNDLIGVVGAVTDVITDLTDNDRKLINTTGVMVPGGSLLGFDKDGKMSFANATEQTANVGDAILAQFVAAQTVLPGASFRPITNGFTEVLTQTDDVVGSSGVGQPVYLSKTESGRIRSTQPSTSGDVIHVVGWASLTTQASLGRTLIMFQPTPMSTQAF